MESNRRHVTREAAAIGFLTPTALFRATGVMVAPPSGAPGDSLYHIWLRAKLKRFVINFLLKRKLDISVYIKVVGRITSFPMSSQPSLQTIPTRDMPNKKLFEKSLQKNFFC